METKNKTFFKNEPYANPTTEKAYRTKMAWVYGGAFLLCSAAIVYNKAGTGDTERGLVTREQVTKQHAQQSAPWLSQAPR